MILWRFSTPLYDSVSYVSDIEYLLSPILRQTLSTGLLLSIQLPGSQYSDTALYWSSSFDDHGANT